MSNPSGPYPGRQLFLGLTPDARPCLVYLVTGRSPESRRRRAVMVENTVRIGPVEEDIPYDPLRHYTALKYDEGTGVAAVGNGIQTEAIYETYRLMCNVGTPPAAEYMGKVLDGAGAEPDSLHTPRIAGAVVPGKDNPVLITGIKTFGSPAGVRTAPAAAGKLSGVATYRGDMENPEAASPDAPLTAIEFSGSTSRELAGYLYDISATTCKGEDIRVCAVAGIRTGNSWEIAIINEH